MSDKKMWTIEYSDADDPKAAPRRIEIEAEKLMFNPGNNYSEPCSVDAAIKQIWRDDPDIFQRDIEKDCPDCEGFEPDSTVVALGGSWKTALGGEPVEVGRDWDRRIDIEGNDWETFTQVFSANVALYDGGRKLTREDLFVKEKDEGRGGR